MWSVAASGTPKEVRHAIQREAEKSDDPSARGSVGALCLLIGGMRLSEVSVEATGAAGGSVHVRLAGRLRERL